MAKTKKRVPKPPSTWAVALLSRMESEVMAVDSLPVLQATNEQSALAEMEAMDPVPFLALWNNQAANGTSLSISGTAVDRFLHRQGVDESHRKFMEMRLACGDLLAALAGTVMTLGRVMDREEPAPISFTTL